MTCDFMHVFRNRDNMTTTATIDTKASPANDNAKPDPTIALQKTIVDLQRETENLRARNEQIRAYSDDLYQRVEKERSTRIKDDLFAIVIVVGILVLTGFSIWRLTLGNAHGEQARKNAEKVALNYYRVSLPVPAVSVVCSVSNENGICGGNQYSSLCIGKNADGSQTFPLCCDDDYPVSNDGCVVARYAPVSR